MGAPVRIGIIGASWRAQYILRIAAAAPERFEVGGMLVARESSAESARARWGVAATTDRAAFLREGFDFVVICVPRDVAPELTTAAVASGLPALIETPPADTVDGLRDLYRSLGSSAPVQVAEQYPLQPQIAAQLAVARSGLLGEVHQVRASFAHGYHALNVIRRALGVGFEPVTVSGAVVSDPVVAVRGRDGRLDEALPVVADRTIALLEWGGRSAVYDFDGEQYVSPIRRRSLSITGSRGELETDSVAYLDQDDDPVEETLRRHATGLDGDLDGYHLERITLGPRTLYSNPMRGARLNDDEIAVADLLLRMSEFCRGGTSFSSLADACHDHALGLLVEASARARTSLTSEAQPWDSAQSDTRTAAAR
ncbi:Gfo/Idh/MocA family oxidoreductase [Leifsonia shinshuensis]|uniref:Gfo/Idh/MocA family protein n=1 Tax=Leifsonia shinshuensis TaxID=150026 RepID=UPI001F50F9FE|nr:Gfo/Idh/MocA family oxidoreductase [Leifsonia shinshuensis]MCI0157769.1 Gfo/Idh/MocA family oxidoreductase [Leifsonia shinshuensis]